MKVTALPASVVKGLSRAGFVFSLTVALVLHLAVLSSHAKDPDAGLKDISSKKEKNGDIHERIKNSIKRLEQVHDGGEAITAHIDEVVKSAEAIESEDAANLKKLEQIEKKLNEMGGVSTVLSRHRNAMEKFREKAAERKGHFDGIKKARGQMEHPDAMRNRMKDLGEFLERNEPRKEQDIKSTDSGLPWKMAQPGDLHILGDISGAPAGQKTTPAALPPPVADDLSPTIDVQITTEIQQLAASLNNSPLEIFRHVYNNYTYTPYYGSMKGSLDTYWEKEGNDCDLASLLIALFRAANIPARYVRTQILVPMEKIQSLVGVDDPISAANYLANFRIPCSFYTTGGVISHMQIEHVYVEAYVPYANYRGTREDDKGKLWLPFDPSFKRLAVVQDGIDITTAMRFEWKGFTNDYFAKLKNVTPLEFYRSKVDAYIAGNYPDKTLDDLKRKTAIKTMQFDFLPNTLPYDVTSVIGRFSAIPAEIRHTMRFAIPSVLDYPVSLPEVSGRRITLSFKGATAEDQTVIDGYGGIFKTPPYLVKVIPQLRLNGVSVAEGSAMDAGVSADFTVQYTQPAGDTTTFGHHILTGSYNAIGVTSGKVRPEFLSIAEVENSDEVYLSKMLHSLAMKYHDALGKTRQTLNDTMRMQSRTFITEALVSTHEDRQVIMGNIPISFQLAGFTIDAKELSMAAAPIDGKDVDRKKLNFAMTFGYEASYQENRVFEDSMFWVEGTSAVKGMQILTALGIATTDLEPHQTYANPNLPDGVVSDINNALNMGWRVIAPEKTTGLAAVPYIKYDEKTGSAGFMIATSAGGLATETMDMTWLKDFWQKKNINYDLKFEAPESPYLVAMGNAFMVITKKTATCIGTGERAEDEDRNWIITDAKYYMDRNKPIPINAVIPGEYIYKLDGRELFKYDVSTGLDVDSRNSTDLNPDGTYNDPESTARNNMIEEDVALPGKLVPLNSGDRNNNGIPDFADGYDLSGSGPADGSSAPFVPILVNIPEPISLAQAQITFNYVASDPASVSITTETSGRTIYAPSSPGHIRLWIKDGGKARTMKSVANGGDFISPGEVLTVAQLGTPTADNPRAWRVFIEGVVPSSTPGEELISYGINGNYFTDKVRVTVIKPLLVTDYNHDKVIDDSDVQNAALGMTYHFWVNDDDDNGETEGTDIPGSGSNGTSEKVSGVRDLIDYFPVYLNIKELLAQFNPASYQYKLHCDKENVNYIVTELSGARSGEYLTGNSTGLKPATDLVGIGKTLVPKEGTALPADLLAKIKASNEPDYGVILLDGRSAGTCKLKLSIQKQGKTVFESAPLVIKLSGVEDMFRHVNLTSSINNPNAPAIETGEIGEHKARGGEKNRAGEPVNFSDSNTDQKYFVMLPGFKVDGQAARGWNSEMFKRLYWSGSRARFVGVSWFGFENVPDYQQNVLNAFRTASVFGSSLFNVTGNAPVTFMAHSLGSMVVSSYLNDYHLNIPVDQRPNIINYFMFNAAVALEAYLGDYQQYSEGKLDETFSDDDTDNPMVHTDWHGYQKRFAASEWHQFFTDDSRQTITWRNRFSNMPEDINYYSFFSSGEDVLGTHVGSPGLLSAVSNALLNDGRYAWAYQEKWKGRAPFEGLGGTNTMGWGFNDIDQKYNPTPPGNLQPQHLKADDANSTIDNVTLKNLPFFKKFIPDGVSSDLFNTNVEVDLTQNFALESLLAKGIPALTLPAGGWNGFDMNYKLFISKENLVDMNNPLVKNGWPGERKKDNDLDWKHNDIRKVPFTFIYKIFNMINK